MLAPVIVNPLNSECKSFFSFECKFLCFPHLILTPLEQILLLALPECKSPCFPSLNVKSLLTA